MEENTMNIYEKLSLIQQKMSVPKTRYNSFSQFYFRNTEDILIALKPYLDTYGCVILISDEIVEISGRHYVKASARLINASQPDQVIENVAYAREAETKPKFDPSQLTGSASTYARKYALNGLLAIDDVQDADALEHVKETKNDSKPMANDSKAWQSMANDGKQWQAMATDVKSVAKHGSDRNDQNLTSDEQGLEEYKVIAGELQKSSIDLYRGKAKQAYADMLAHLGYKSSSELKAVDYEKANEYLLAWGD